MSAEGAGTRRYRLNVGVALFNAEGRVWLGRRVDAPGPHVWQMPQGGADPGEDLIVAARRELREETGVASARLLACAPGWITYDFPDDFQRSRSLRGFAGQRQVWFAFRFEGEAAEVDLHAHDEPEFDAWRWADLEEAVEEVVPFKRDAYRKVADAFAPIAAGSSPAGRRGPLLLLHDVAAAGSSLERLGEDLALRGWRVEAPTLFPDLRRRSGPPAGFPALGLSDFLREAEVRADALAARCGTRPVVVGHGLGGLLAQALATRGRARAGVLIAPTAPAARLGGAPLSARYAYANLLERDGEAPRAGAPWRRGFEFGVLHRASSERRAAVYEGLVHESGRVIAELFDVRAAAPLPEPEDRSRAAAGPTPLLVVLAGRDRVSGRRPERVLSALGLDAGRAGVLSYPDRGHWIVDEPGADLLAADVDAWLLETLS